MKNTVLLTVLVALSGRASAAAYSSRGISNGFLYAGTKSGEQISDNTVGSKTGEACASSILGLITRGDTSYLTAAKNAGIRKISTIDNRYENILGIYATYCVVVTGEQDRSEGQSSPRRARIDAGMRRAGTTNRPLPVTWLAGVAAYSLHPAPS